MQITDAEWKIMNLLWQQPMTITQITKALAEETHWEKHTVITLLRRMMEKNTVYYEEGKKAKLFFPNVTRSEAELEESKGILQKVFQGKMSLMVDSLVKNEALSEQEIDELCEILNLRRE